MTDRSSKRLQKHLSVACVRGFAAVALALTSACSTASDVHSTAAASTNAAQPSSHHVRAGQALTDGVQHIVILTMENRSFDEMFGTYPGVNGIPSPAPCNPDPRNKTTVCSYHSTTTVEHGGPHGQAAEIMDLDGGKLDGFIESAESPRQAYDPYPDEVMGYHTCSDLPAYCAYAASGVLFDNFYAATTSYSTTSHLYMVSNWSAYCSVPGQASSCVSDNNPNVYSNPPPDYAWTDITWLLHASAVSWGYFVYSNNDLLPRPDDDNDGEMPMPFSQYNNIGEWNPMPGFDTVKLDNETGNIQPGSNFLKLAETGALPVVSWVIPPFKTSDHPTADLVLGQQWVQEQVHAIEAGPDAGSTLILVWWDDWGGFYDHVVPFTVDKLGYGFRTPLIMIGPMVKHGTIDHQLLSSDAFNKLIEDLFLGSQRLDPTTDGRPDPRPDVRETNPNLGDLRLDLQPPNDAGR